MPSHELKILRHEEERAERNEDREDVDRERGGEGGLAKQPDLDQRIAQGALPSKEYRTDGEAGDDNRQRQPAWPELRQPLDAPDHRQHGDDR